MNISKIGHIPWNKNTKGIMRPNKTSFKKGFTPWNKDKLMPKGKYAANWRGGKKKCGKYILIHCPDHPFADEQGYVFEHRLVMEKKIGRYLKPEERVHHINEIPSDNHPDNLMLFRTMTEHLKFHREISKHG